MELTKSTNRTEESKFDTAKTVVDLSVHAHIFDSKTYTNPWQDKGGFISTG